MPISPHRCCPDGCLVFDDGFERANIGCEWDERSGSWSLVSDIDGTRLKEAGNPGALIIAQRAVPDTSFYVAASILDVPAGAVYRVIVNYKDDDNYHFAEFEFTSTTLTIRLRKRSGGSNSTLLERSWTVNMIGNEQTFGVCFSDKVFSASQLYAPFEAWVLDPTPIADGYQAGLGNGGSVAIEYDSFMLEENYDSNPDCQSCVCRCDDVALPMEVTAKLEFINSLGACKDTTLTLKAIDLYAGCDTPTDDFAQGVWYGCVVPDCSECNEPETFEVYVTFRCSCSSSEKRFWARLASNDLGPDSNVCEKRYNCLEKWIEFEFSPWHEGGECSGQSGDGADVLLTISW